VLALASRGTAQEVPAVRCRAPGQVRQRAACAVPREIYRRLEELGYRGQNEARRAVALMAYRHVRRIKRIYVDGIKREHLLPRPTPCSLDPPGAERRFWSSCCSSRSYTCPLSSLTSPPIRKRAMWARIRAPSSPAFCTRPTTSPAGCHRHRVSRRVRQDCLGPEQCRVRRCRNHKDVTGLGVQRELLKMLESSEVVVPLEMTHSTFNDHVLMSTADVAFHRRRGVFPDFTQLARRRAAGDSIGLPHPAGSGSPTRWPSATHPMRSSSGQFQAYGFLPSCWRASHVSCLSRPSDAATLTDILKSNVVDRLTREFEDEGFELQIEEPSLGIVARA